MSHPDDQALTEAQQYERDQADKLLDVMDSLAPLLIRSADAFTKRNPDIEISARDWQQFVATVEDAVSDLLHDQRERLALEYAKDRRYMPRTKSAKAGTAMGMFDQVVGTIRAYNKALYDISTPPFPSEPRYVASVTEKAITALGEITGTGEAWDDFKKRNADRMAKIPASRRVVNCGMSCQDLGE